MAEDKNVSYTYKIDLKFYLPKMDPIEPYMVTRLVKHFNYFDTFCSFYECEALVDRKYTEIIRNNQNVIYCNLIITLEKTEIVNMENKLNDEADKNVTPFSTEEILNHTFIPFFTDNSFSDVTRPSNYNQETTVDSGEKILADDGTELEVVQSRDPVTNLPQKIIFALYSVTGLNINKTILNFVSGECDVGTMVKYLISSSNVEEAIVDKPDNDTTYQNIVVSPHNLNNAIKDLQARYGIYNSGLCVFYEPPTFYVLKKITTEHDRSDKQYSTLKLNIYCNPSTSLTNIAAAIESENGKSLEYNMNTVLERSNIDIYNSELMGNEFLYSNYALSTSVIKYKKGLAQGTNTPIVSIVMPNVKHKSTNNKVIVEYDELNNSFNMASVAKNMSLHTTVKIKEMFGIREDTFRPNSIFLLSVKDDQDKNDELNGLYSILKGDIEYRRISSSENTYTCKVINIFMSGVDDK